MAVLIIKSKYSHKDCEILRKVYQVESATIKWHIIIIIIIINFI